MVTVQDYHYTRTIWYLSFYTVEDLRINRPTFNKCNPIWNRIAFNAVAIVWSDVNINSNDASFANQFQHRRHHENRTTPRNSDFDNDVRLCVPNYFLRGHDIRRHLDDRNTHPRPQVGVIVAIKLCDQVSWLVEDGAVAA